MRNYSYIFKEKYLFNYARMMTSDELFEDIVNQSGQDYGTELFITERMVGVSEDTVPTPVRFIGNPDIYSLQHLPLTQGPNNNAQCKSEDSLVDPFREYSSIQVLFPNINSICDTLYKAANLIILTASFL